MTKRESLIREVEDAPEPLLDELLAAVRALKERHRRPAAEDRAPAITALASEQVLGRDWLTPEEDEAWSHL